MENNTPEKEFKPKKNTKKTIAKVVYILFNLFVSINWGWYDVLYTFVALGKGSDHAFSYLPFLSLLTIVAGLIDFYIYKSKKFKLSTSPKTNLIFLIIGIFILLSHFIMIAIIAILNAQGYFVPWYY
jgi:hypothetical protein